MPSTDGDRLSDRNLEPADGSGKSRLPVPLYRKTLWEIASERHWEITSPCTVTLTPANSMS
jgi:hypothetical protein